MRAYYRWRLRVWCRRVEEYRMALIGARDGLTVDVFRALLEGAQDWRLHYAQKLSARSGRPKP